MRKVTIKSIDLGEWQHKAYLIDDNHGIYAAGGSIYLFKVQPTDNPDIFHPAGYGNYIIIGKGQNSRPVLEKMVTRLKSMSAYDLITSDFDVDTGDFNVSLN